MLHDKEFNWWTSYLAGTIRVYCRVRPFLPGQSNGQSTVDYIGENGNIMIVNPLKQGKDARRVFSFNKVFGTNVTQGILCYFNEVFFFLIKLCVHMGVFPFLCPTLLFWWHFFIIICRANICWHSAIDQVCPRWL